MRDNVTCAKCRDGDGITPRYEPGLCDDCPDVIAAAHAGDEPADDEPEEK